MSFSAKLETLVAAYGRSGESFVPARLQSMLALLESLRVRPSLTLTDHLSSAGQSLKSHEPLAGKAMKRLNLTSLNKNSGRRSSNLHAWAGPLLGIMEAEGFPGSTEETRIQLIDKAQAVVGSYLRSMFEEGPLRIKVIGKTAEAVIGELLKQADKKNKAGDVAQYLVGAKLAIRLQIEIPVHGANKGDRKSHADKAARLGDFEIGNSIIEVAIGIPDEKHLQQIEEILDTTHHEIWLLTREDRVASWKNEVSNLFGKRIGRIVVTSVEAFVGQNVTELAGFTAAAKSERIHELIDLYNRRWVDKVGTPSIRVSIE